MRKLRNKERRLAIVAWLTVISLLLAACGGAPPAAAPAADGGSAAETSSEPAVEMDEAALKAAAQKWIDKARQYAQ